LFEREARSRNRDIWLSGEDLKNPSRVAEALTADDLARAVRQRGIAKALADLSNDDLQIRDAATQSLKEAGAKARGSLRKALAQATDAETRSRLEAILKP